MLCSRTRKILATTIEDPRQSARCFVIIKEKNSLGEHSEEVGITEPDPEPDNFYFLTPIPISTPTLAESESVLGVGIPRWWLLLISTKPFWTIWEKNFFQNVCAA